MDSLKKERVWEIDALRGYLIICLLAWHLYLTVDAFCINGYYHINSYRWVEITDPMRIFFNWGDDGIIHKVFMGGDSSYTLQFRIGVDVFFIISGISCMFSRHNLKRAIKTLIAGIFIAVFTYGLSIWTGDPTRFIRFGALMCYAFCQFFYVILFEKMKNRWLIICTIPIFLIGYYIRYVGVAATRLPLLYIFGVPQIGDQSSDFWPILPMLGWFLLGVVIGRKYYSEKKTRLPYKLPDKLTKPLQFLGRYSGIIYVSHIVIYTAVFCGIGYLFHLL